MRPVDVIFIVVLVMLTAIASTALYFSVTRDNSVPIFYIHIAGPGDTDEVIAVTETPLSLPTYNITGISGDIFTMHPDGNAIEITDGGQYQVSYSIQIRAGDAGGTAARIQSDIRLDDQVVDNLTDECIITRRYGINVASLRASGIVSIPDGGAISLLVFRTLGTTTSTVSPNTNYNLYIYKI